MEKLSLGSLKITLWDCKPVTQGLSRLIGLNIYWNESASEFLLLIFIEILCATLFKQSELFKVWSSIYDLQKNVQCEVS